MGFEELLGVNPWTALFTLANTVALFLVMKKFLFVPVMKMIDARQAEIDGMYADAEQAKAEAKAMEEQYRQELIHAQATSDRLVKEAVVRGLKREEEIVNQANEMASGILAKATADIELEKKKALNDAKDEISSLAMAVAEKVIGRELNSADQSVLVDRFIDELGDNA